MASTGIEDTSRVRSIIERLVCEKVLPELVTRAHAHEAGDDGRDESSADLSSHDPTSFQEADPAPMRLGVLDQLRLKYERLTMLATAQPSAMRPSFWWQSDWPRTKRTILGANRMDPGAHISQPKHQRFPAA